MLLPDFIDIWEYTDLVKSRVRVLIILREESHTVIVLLEKHLKKAYILQYSHRGIINYGSKSVMVV